MRATGRRQSPIAFWDDDVVVNTTLPMITFINYDQDIRATVENNGHTSGHLPFLVQCSAMGRAMGDWVQSR